MQKERRGEPPLTVRYPHGAGIDIGKKELYVAVAEDAAVENVRTFGTYTAALKQRSSWLHDCGVPQVAMEATGVYWIPVYELLERAGFEVRLVDPRATKRLDGRKSDALDCQWIRQMMSMGMLSGAYRRECQKFRVLSLDWIDSEHRKHWHTASLFDLKNYGFEIQPFEGLKRPSKWIANSRLNDCQLFMGALHFSVASRMAR